MKWIAKLRLRLSQALSSSSPAAKLRKGCSLFVFGFVWTLGEKARDLKDFVFLSRQLAGSYRLQASSSIADTYGYVGRISSFYTILWSIIYAQIHNLETQISYLNSICHQCIIRVEAKSTPPFISAGPLFKFSEIWQIYPRGKVCTLAKNQCTEVVNCDKWRTQNIRYSEAGDWGQLCRKIGTHSCCSWA